MIHHAILAPQKGHSRLGQGRNIVSRETSTGWMSGKDIEQNWNAAVE
jgi:hypothetical protein